jgi:hypothetical protein
MQVGRGFKEDVTSAPNTTMILRTREEETARYFIRASAETRVRKRSLAMERVFWKYREDGRATESEAIENRAQDEHIKNLPKGQMEILMTDDTRGTLHSLLHVRPPSDLRSAVFEPELYPLLRQPRSEASGVNLRFKDPELAGSFRLSRR